MMRFYKMGNYSYDKKRILRIQKVSGSMQGLSLAARTFLTSWGSKREGFLRFKDCLSNSLIHSPHGGGGGDTNNPIPLMCSNSIEGLRRSVTHLTAPKVSRDARARTGKLNALESIYNRVISSSLPAPRWSVTTHKSEPLIGDWRRCILTVNFMMQAAMQ